ncbi:RNA-binding cell elongation regulator Jag/EloR [Chloroflexota bacterium]
MESLEVNAKTVEEAIHLALEQLNASREEVEVTVVKEGKSGILKLGSEEATVRVTLLTAVSEEEGDVSKQAKGILEDILAFMDIDASVVVKVGPGTDEQDTAPITLDIEGGDLGILIGRRGQTLSSLQYIVRLILAHQTKAWLPITIDVEGYKQRRYESLQSLVWRLAEQVQTRREPFTLEPMPAYERRIIHLSLAEHPQVSTYSIGIGESRKVVIEPKGQ